MRLVLMTVVLAVSALAAQAQSLEEKRDKKLKSPFLGKAAWVTDYDQAREAAKKEGKLIFAYFTRSYSP
ncbi:MAG: hypothetical protein HYY16_17135 [Planctomycetes bacterium]|nr:hypothetical protein [Planctomycetota bacterium]